MIPRLHLSRPSDVGARLLVWAALLASSCSGPEPDVVLYCALDQIHSEPIIRDFEQRTGLRVKAQYDVEAHKTVGLVRRIREEAGFTRCDGFWNNEIAHTVQLAADGLLASYDSPSAADIPEEFRDPERRWTGFAARARVFILNTDRVSPDEVKGMWDLVEPAWRDKVGMARPLTGTTLTHMTALHITLGEEEAASYLEAISEGGVNLTGGNMMLAKLVGSGELAWGWTDTDDFNVARLKGYPVAVVYPDQEGEDAIGTLVIPNTVAIMKNAPHLEAAKTLIDWVLSEETEAALAAASSGQIPVRAHVPRPASVRGLDEMRVMQVSYVAIGLQIAKRTEHFKELFLR